MSGDRAWTAPEMTPVVDVPDEKERALEDRRGVVDKPTRENSPEPGDVPGIGARVEGRSRVGTASGADDTDEGEGAERPKPGA